MKGDCVKCGHIVPRRETIHIVLPEDYLPECILPNNHRGPHAFKTPNGEIYKWDFDWKCGCCSVEEDERCYIYVRIDDSRLQELLEEKRVE